MELDRFEYEMLDAILEAFGQHDSLTREQIMDIFDHDEDYAASMIGFLESSGLVSVVGNRLPLLVNKEPSVVTFLENGGFANSNETPVIKQTPEAEQQKIHQQTLPAPEIHPAYDPTLGEHNKRLNALELKVKHLEYLKYLLWGAALAIILLAVWIIRLLPHHHR
jgi:hypothetical protein